MSGSELLTRSTDEDAEWLPTGEILRRVAGADRRGCSAGADGLFGFALVLLAVRNRRRDRE